MVVGAVDAALESLLRSELPLPEDVGEVSFDPPDRSWGASVSRITVNVFLFDVGRAEQPAAGPGERLDGDGVRLRRGSVPMSRLNYLVTAWAGSVRDEHQLLGDVLGCFLRHPYLPAEHLPTVLPGTVQLQILGLEGRKSTELWSAIDGRLRAGFQLQAIAPHETLPWLPAPPEVTRVEGQTNRRPPEPRRSAVAQPGPARRARSGSAVVAEGRPGTGP